MNSLKGLIIIDYEVIVARIYQQVEKNNWHPLYDKKINILHPNRNDPYERIEHIITIFTETSVFGIEEWKFYTKDTNKNIIEDISLAISYKIETISSQKEQGLLLDALLQELMVQEI